MLVRGSVLWEPSTRVNLTLRYETKRADLVRLLDGTDGVNFSEAMWLKSEIAAVDAKSTAPA